MSQIFHVILVRPSHYDDDGYPITWRQGIIPSNSIATVYGMLTDCARRRVLGDHVDIRVRVMDEANRRIVPERIAAAVKKAGNRGFVALAGVQTNQFPRAMDLADRFLRAGLPVCVGGFHVSGWLATMKDVPEEVREAQKKGISFFAGEGENGRVEQVLKDAWNGKLAPLYNFLGQLVDLKNEPVPVLPEEEIRQTAGCYTAFDLGRGCPFHCSFCTIINVHGHESRFRTADDLEKIIRENHERGFHRYFLTDDNIARNRNWEAFFDRMAALRKEGIRIRMLIQVDTGSYRIPGFIQKAVAAGVDQIFVGMESINPENLAAVNKKQNKVATYQEALRAWKQYPVVITAAYIVGLPGDTKDTVLRDIDTIKRELPIDTIYFTNLTPLPGSVDHQKMREAGEWMSSDLNLYDTHHCVTNHPLMSADEWQDANRAAWRRFYTDDHMTTVLRRMVAARSDKKLTTINRLALYSWFGCHTTIHPIDGGLMRRRYRRDRRPGLPLENPFVFYPRHFATALYTYVRIHLRAWRLWRKYRQIVSDPHSLKYADAATGTFGSAPIRTDDGSSPDQT